MSDLQLLRLGWYRHIDYELGEVQWDRIRSLLPGRADTVGHMAEDNHSEL